MENYTEKLVDWDDLEFPETIYKYRTWKDDYHKTVISKRQIYMSPPLGFEDPLDCKNQIRYDLLRPEEIFGKYYMESRKLSPQLPHNEHLKFAMYWFKKSPLHDKENTKRLQEEDFLKYNDRAGILSLTANPVRPEMWEKYSDKHSGVCIGFNSQIMFKYLGGGCPVTYCEELPVIKPSPWDPQPIQLIKQVYYKLNKWTFEEEYRTEIFDINPLTDDQRKIALPTEAYKEIIFGAKISKQHQSDIIDIAKQTVPHVTFRQAKITDAGIILDAMA